MRVLDDFVCTSCGLEEERLHEQGTVTVPCSECGLEMRRRMPKLQHIENFGALGVAHTPGRRLAKAEQERRDWYRQTRHKEANPESMTPRPRIFG